MAKEQTGKQKQLCPECGAEFVGAKCPQCGNDKENISLADDGIDQTLHRPGFVFNAKNFKSKESLLSPNAIMSDEAAKTDLEEMQSNLRESYVLKSKIRKKELELDMLRKQQAFDAEKAALDGGGKNAGPRKGQYGYQGYQDPYVQYGMPQDPMQPSSIFPSANPQVAVTTYLMKMEKDKRREFLDSLAEAEPQALQTLGSLLAPTAPQPSPYMNPYGIPPWMMNPMYAAQFQQQPQQSQEREDPVSVALALIGQVKELVGGGNSGGSSEALNLMKEQAKELRDEVRSLREKLSNPPQPAIPAEYKVLCDDIRTIKSQLSNGGGGNIGGIAGSLKQLTGVVKDLEEIGLVQKPGAADKTVDDEIKLKKMDHEIKMDEQKLRIEQDRVDTEKSRADLAKGVLAGAFQRSMAKRAEKDAVLPSPQSGRLSPSVRVTPSAASAPAPVDRPPEIIQEYPSETGRVYETRAPVKRAATGVL